ncbi:Vitamin B12 transporter BtuB [Ralstonia condita]|uniref:Vitamin B12 transporter BtuB n=1 Tax=Ralstonia condita TaxID=3058600 RepID=A0ABM9IXX9_9RALS|nr:TonB-dependent receptor [Ralstonia sp. LMG 7141]CAJ0775989.1 Vitamin B12 transporter BtuB [Ralstonia sp. LMG 7141]
MSRPHVPWHRSRHAALRLCSASALACGPALAMAQAAPPVTDPLLTLATTTVIGTTPLLGVGTPLSQVSANVQTLRGSDLRSQHRTVLTDDFEKNLPSVDINEVQGNPYQTDLHYRGFTASPVLGTPQGLSVFVDGVRANEPFGDVVNWDLIPRMAIDTIQLIPGSNPTYGLNTLGGAITIATKNGKQSRGGSAEVSGGSWGRKSAQAEQGGTIGSQLDYYVSASALNDNGWADHNASRIRQAFGKLRYTGADTTLSLSMGGADNTLQGTQTIPRAWLGNPAQPYTFPDTNQNSTAYVTLSGDHAFSDDLQLSANVYYRHFRNANLSSNVNEDFGSVDANGNVDTVQSRNAQSVISTDSYGAGVQLTRMDTIAGRDNQLVVGAAADFANSGFTQASQDAFFTDARASIGTGDFTQTTHAKTRNSNLGVYFNNTLSLGKPWTLTLAGRYNVARAVIRDASGAQPLLDGDHTFSRFNPAIGLNWNPTPGLTAYATYNEGMRAPTAIELACADPAAPCSLPNNFIADPPLKPVVSKTFEVGLRGRVGQATTWSAAVYNTTLNDDIQFVSAGAASTLGFFQNVGRTRRQGFELAGRTQAGPLGISASYSYVSATYRSAWTEHSPSNSSADAGGNISIKPGDRIPGIPESTAKLRLDYSATPKWKIGTSLVWRGSIYARGDENNADANGRLSGYFLADLDTTYQVTRQLQVFATVSNLFNHRYQSFGVLGANAFTGPNNTFNGTNPVSGQFVAPGAPRSVWIGLRYAWQ